MKHTFLILTALLFLSVSGSRAQDFHVGSFNIRMQTSSDTGNLWVDRKAPVTNLIKFHEFHIFGIQEGLKEQIHDLNTLLPDYGYVGVGRDDGKKEGEFSAIYYLKSRFEVEKSGTFWLTEKDVNQPNKGWDAALPRICTWGIFTDKDNGKKFIFMNTHFDHVGVTARSESAKQILAKAKEFAADLPLILTGDFNVNEDNDAYKLLANSGIVADTYEIAPLNYLPNSSFNSWGRRILPKGRIDHIFVTPNFKVVKYGLLTDTYMGKFPSDHFPVFSKLKW